jgi:ribosomal protein L7/L12
MRKIEAIKVYREETGVGLTEAKEAVEAYIHSK